MGLNFQGLRINLSKQSPEAWGWSLTPADFHSVSHVSSSVCQQLASRKKINISEIKINQSNLFFSSYFFFSLLTIT